MWSVHLKAIAILFWAERFGKQIGMRDLWIKQCGNSQHQQFSRFGHDRLSQCGQTNDGAGQACVKAVACASTAMNTSASAMLARETAGYPAIVFLPNNKVSAAQLAQPIANGVGIGV